jgi:hypothetical protein
MNLLWCTKEMQQNIIIGKSIEYQFEFFFKSTLIYNLKTRILNSWRPILMITVKWTRIRNFRQFKNNFCTSIQRIGLTFDQALQKGRKKKQMVTHNSKTKHMAIS